MIKLPVKNSCYELKGVKDQHTISQSPEMHLEKIENNSKEIRTYKRRFWMLFVYLLLAVVDGMFYPEYISMANVTGCYYEVSQYAVNLTSESSMIILLLFLIPASFLMNYMDIKSSLICASCLTTIASALQFFTLKPDGFLFVVISSFFASAAGLFIMGQPPFLAAKWFPSNELSRACAVGIFGNQIAVSIGFIFAPLMVSRDCSLKDDIARGKRNVATIFTIASGIILLLLIFTFQSKPRTPPSLSQYEVENRASGKETMRSIMRLLQNPDFVLVMVVNGLVAGVFYAFTTNANNLMVRFFPGKELEISWMSTLFSLMGIVSSLVTGYVLDYTHKFKELAVAYSVMSFLSAVFFSCLIYSYTEKLWPMFVISGIFGFFVAGFLPVGVEYALEVTFPESEMITATLTIWFMQIFGIISIHVVLALLNNYGSLPSNATICIILLISAVISSFLTRNYKRYRKNCEENGVDGFQNGKYQKSLQ